MKAIISSTYDNQYLWNLPLVTFLWNKLGVDVICFMPRFGAGHVYGTTPQWLQLSSLVHITMKDMGIKYIAPTFDAPDHKQATYAQCARLYGACLDLPEDEILITSDVDMVVFKLPEYKGGFTIFGYDLVPEKQYPMCYISAKVKDWRNAFELNNKSYQQALDEILAHEECDHFRGNLWGRDQETAYNKINITQELYLVPRARQGTQFSSSRYDRDDSFILERLNPDTIDFHMNRPGYEEKNFEIIRKVLEYHFPNDGFDWLIKYTEKYTSLL